MATILPEAKTQFTDALGVPLAGGAVYFYAPNTSTPKTTYQDALQTIPNSNPVILDSAGRAIILGSGSYRQVVKDANGNTIWDQITSEAVVGQTSFGGTSTGSANAQVVSAGTFSGADGSVINFTAGFSNTGATTLTVGSGSPIAILKNTPTGPNNLVIGDLVAGNAYSVSYSVSLGAFQLAQPTAAAIASLADAQAGTDNIKTMTPLRTYQAIQQFSVLSPALRQASWPLRYNAAGTAAEYVHPLTAGNFSGLSVVVASNTQVTVTGVLGLSVTADITVSGANGLDTGAEAASTWYNVWVIWNGATAAALLSTSATAPTMPASYTQKIRVGAVRNDGSSNLWRTLQYGRRVQVAIGTNPTTTPIIRSGSTSAVYTAASVSSFVPPTASTIWGILIGAASDNTVVMVAPNANYGVYNSSTNGPPVGNGNSGITGSTIFTNSQFNFVLESSNIYYSSSHSNAAATLSGWEDNV